METVTRVAMKASVCIPSHRPLFESAPTICKIAAAASDEIEVVISDNSLDPAKRAFLTEMAHRNPHVTCIFHESEIPPLDNFSAALHHSTGELIQFCADDDILTAGSIARNRRALLENPDLTCHAAATVDHRPNGGNRLVQNIKYTGTRFEKVTDYLINRNAGINPLFYSMQYRQTWEVYLSYVNSHPFVTMFFDYHLPIISLSAGNGEISSKGMYIFNNENWETYEQCVISRERFYSQQGVPLWFVHFESLYRAVEFLLFIGGDFLQTEEKSQRLTLGLHVSKHFAQSWLRSIPHFFSLIPKDLQLLVRAHVEANGTTEINAPDAVTLFFKILDRGMPEKARPYKDFFSANMGM